MNWIKERLNYKKTCLPLFEIDWRTSIQSINPIYQNKVIKMLALQQYSPLDHFESLSQNVI